MFEAEQQLAPESEARKSWGEAASTPATRATFVEVPGRHPDAWWASP